MAFERIPFAPLAPETVVVVTGSRVCTANGKHWVFTILDELQPYFVIQGGALGIDRAARDWCRDRVVRCAQVDPPWGKLRHAAGPVRNGWMLDLCPDCVVAFPGDVGTLNMCDQARKRGVRIIQAWNGPRRSAKPPVQQRRG